MPLQNDRERLVEHLDGYTREWVRYAEEFKSYVLELFDEFILNDLADAGFINKLTGCEESFYQALWEMQLARHLFECGFTPQKVPHGPDFKIAINNQTAWVEAIAPTRGTGPSGVPDFFEELTRNSVFGFPYQAIQQRYTAAIKAKKEKHDSYLLDGIVQGDEPYIIAVNGAMFRGWSFEHINGLPLACCAVFPIGESQIYINIESGDVTGTSHVYTPVIFNHNGAPITADNFLNPAYKYVSAILSVCAHPIEPHSPSALIHNPLAENPLAIGVLGAEKDFFVSNQEESPRDWELTSESCLVGSGNNET